jgi:hypothetical protein
MMSVPEPKAAFGWVPCHVAKGPEADVGRPCSRSATNGAVVQMPKPLGGSFPQAAVGHRLA